MSFESVLRNDILDPELLKSKSGIKVIAETQFVNIIQKAHRPPTKTPLPAKNIVEVMSLFSEAFKDYEIRTHTTEDARVKLLYEKPDREAQLEAISIILEKREPGMYGQGRPFENDVRQLRPLLREETEDPDHPGYKRAVLGQFYDNMLRLTAWARTNKAANDRALWIENVMEEYTWFFVYSGVNRVLYQGRSEEQVREVNGNKIYGKPIDYFVRTEKLRNVSQKELEEVCIRLAIVTNA